MPDVPIVVHHDDGEDAGCEQLLALHRMRRDLERLAPRRRPDGGIDVALSRLDLVRELTELIEALDRRLPNVEQAGEIAIARDAAALRQRAVERLDELSRPLAPQYAHVVPPRS